MQILNLILKKINLFHLKEQIVLKHRHFLSMPLLFLERVLKEHLLKEKERLLSLPEDVREKKEEEIDNIEKGLRYYE